MRHLCLALVTLALALPACGEPDTSGVATSTVTGGGGGGGEGGAGTTSATTTTTTETGSFTLTSSAFVDGGTLPVDYTCDGAGNSPPLAWTNTPAGTVELAVLMTTVAPDGLKWNWVLYHVPGDVTSLPEAETGIGTAGLTSDGPNLAYSPPCSQGPGPKTYTFEVYALDAVPVFSVPPNKVTGKVVTDAISASTLATSAISVTYTRP